MMRRALLLVCLGLWGCGRESAPELPAEGSPGHLEFLRRFQTGLLAMESGITDRAQKEFEACAALVPGEPASILNLALLHAQAGRDSAAEALLARAERFPEASVPALLARADLAKRQGRGPEALSWLEKGSATGNTALLWTWWRERRRQNRPDSLPLLESLLQRQPRNVALLAEKAEALLRRGDTAYLAAARAAAADSGSLARLAMVEKVLRSGDREAALLEMAFFRNLLIPHPGYQRDLRALAPEDGPEPLSPLRLGPPPPLPADSAWAFEPGNLFGPQFSMPILRYAVLLEGGKDSLRLLLATEDSLAEAASAGPQAGLKAVPGMPPDIRHMLPGDFDNDGALDVLAAWEKEWRILSRDSAGLWKTGLMKLPRELEKAPPLSSLSADLDADGDLDLVLGPAQGGLRPAWNLDGRRFEAGPDLWPGHAVRQIAAADFTGEGFADLIALDKAGDLAFFRARRPGEYEAPQIFGPRGRAIALGDFENDGTFDVAVLDLDGFFSFWSFDAAQGALAAQAIPRPPFAMPVDEFVVGDLDHNGRLDLAGASISFGRAWLRDGAGWIQRDLPSRGPLRLHDVNRDGKPDILAQPQGGSFPSVLLNRGRHPGLRVAMEPATARGDGRINTFGIGAILELRGAMGTQRRLRENPVTHFAGLGAAGLKIIWPNGTSQAELDLGDAASLTVQQRLKGSCPWVFARDGKGFAFVTDFLWGSPLGLQINAQAAASVARTFDRVRMPPGLPALRDSLYEVRVTAELWETHFFDYFALTAVDHEPGTEAYVDERFCFPAPSFAPRVFRQPLPVAQAWDGRGRDVTAVVRERDGLHLEDFGLGRRQGLSEDHFVEFEADPPEGSGAFTLLAHGWIYPTDSSVNRALGQAGSPKPRGLQLLGWVGGRWQVLHADLGFPAGKSKTLLIPLRENVRRYRLSTNLEIYWDALRVAREAGPPLQEHVLKPVSAELRRRGFSHFRPRKGGSPELPVYDSLQAGARPWRNLEGFHTRYGTVLPLVEKVDDRYIIANAGDEVALAFRAPPARPGSLRTVFLDGDGWEKDGDYNTFFGETVTPLPSHDNPAYAGPRLPLDRDPIFLRHRRDWALYHTRYEPGDFRAMSRIP